VQVGSDIDGEAADDRFGSSVSINDMGNVVAIGAMENTGTETGYAKIYKNISGSWTQFGEDLVGEAIDDRFGYSVSICDQDDVAAIGGYLNDGTGSQAGHVRVYELKIPPTITEHPSDQTNICSGTTINFTVSGDNISQWQWECHDGGSWAAISDNAFYSGTLSGTLSVLADMSFNGYQYRCVVRNGISTETSDPATLTVLQSTSNPIPADLSIDVSINQNISWDIVAGALSYNVYFGEAGSLIFIGNQTALTYDPGVLYYSSEYEWQILPVTAAGTAVGCHIWSFTTELNQNPPSGNGVAINDNGAKLQINLIKFFFSNYLFFGEADSKKKIIEKQDCFYSMDRMVYRF